MDDDTQQSASADPRPDPEPSIAGAEPVERENPNTAHTPVRRVQPPAPAAAVIITVEQRRPATEQADRPEDRRDFFSDAMREALAPFAGIIERKINPLLAALEAIPTEVDHLANVKLPALSRVLDQPMLAGTPDEAEPRTVPLPLAAGIANDEPRHLRPPGALPPGEFENVCSRCGKCVEVRPANAIQMDYSGFTAGGMPYVRAVEGACVVCTDLACMPACPTGALKPLDRLQIRMGTARVDHQQCLRDRGEDCRLCVEACPITGDGAPAGLDALVIHAESGRIRVRKNVCIGCGLCESRCPTEPRAIWVVPARGKVEPIVA